MDHPFHRLELLLGDKCLEKLASVKVIIFGVGGVGSWCAEALVRSGIHNLTIVDFDVVCETNINRQLQATSVSVGKSKADEL
ncbi:MAG: ThiF family adenylyltransferase, partial [Chitinispirillales bacterium]|nr:ThiF family adenylyltransferase [Chitinispirillales bacterium]